MPCGGETATRMLAAPSKRQGVMRNTLSVIRQGDFYRDTLSAKLGDTTRPDWQRTKERNLDGWTLVPEDRWRRPT